VKDGRHLQLIGKARMGDVIFIGIAVVFFAAGLVYTLACEKL
jgi:hypothetical protein